MIVPIVPETLIVIALHPETVHLARRHELQHASGHLPADASPVNCCHQL
jgi:hypothetical protein